MHDVIKLVIKAFILITSIKLVNNKFYYINDLHTSKTLGL